MKAQPSTPTLIVNHDRSRAIVILFAGLLIVAAAIIGSVLALSWRAPAAEIAARGSTNHLLIAHCRACWDEALAASQAGFNISDDLVVFPQPDDARGAGPR
jgi:hypothetical protein